MTTLKMRSAAPINPKPLVKGSTQWNEGLGMTDDVNARLDAIFNSRSEREAEAARSNVEAERNQRINLEEFMALMESLIRPTLETLAQNIKDRGHQCSVFEIADGEHLGGKRRDAAIGIRFLVDASVSQRHWNDYPHLTMSVDKANRQIEIYSSTMVPGKGGSSGGELPIAFEALTVDLIHQKALKIIAAVYK